MLHHPISITHEETIMPKKIRKFFRKLPRPIVYALFSNSLTGSAYYERYIVFVKSFISDEFLISL